MMPYLILNEPLFFFMMQFIMHVLANRRIIKMLGKSELNSEEQCGIF